MPKQKSKPRKAVAQSAVVSPLRVVLVVVALALVAGSVVLYRHLQPPASSASQTLLTRVQNRVAETYDNLSADAAAWPAQMGTGIAIAAPNYNFQISSQSLPSIYFTMKESSAVKAVPRLKTAVSPHDATAILDATITHAGYIAYVDSANTTTYIDEQGNKCFSAYDPTDVLTLSCYNDNDIENAAAKLQPLVEAYTAARANSGTPATFYGPATIKSQRKAGVIQPSYTPGYDIAEMIVQNGTSKQLALFYNKDGGPWQYVTEAGDEFGFACNAFTANTDVRSAMHNQICLSGHGQVRLDTNNAALQ